MWTFWCQKFQSCYWIRNYSRLWIGSSYIRISILMDGAFWFPCLRKSNPLESSILFYLYYDIALRYESSVIKIWYLNSDGLYCLIPLYQKVWSIRTSNSVLSLLWDCSEDFLTSELPIELSDKLFCQNFKLWKNNPSESPIGLCDVRISNSDGLDFLIQHIHHMSTMPDWWEMRLMWFMQ